MTSSSVTNEPKKFDGIAEDPGRTTYSIWGSVRLTYTICAFIAMILHLCMRNALSFAILCMVKSDPNKQQPNAQALEEFNKCGALQLNTTNRINEASFKQFIVEAPKSYHFYHKNAEFDWSRSQEFFLLGCFYYGYLVALPIAGRICDKFGGKMCFIHSMTLQAIAFILTPFFARLNYISVVVLRVIQGLFAGFGNPAIYQIYSVWAHPSERTALMSAAYGGYPLGALLVFPISSFLCRFGWSMVFYSIGGTTLIFGICCHWLVYSTLESHPRLSKKELDYLKINSHKQSQAPAIPWKNILSSLPVYAFFITHTCHTFGIIVLTLLLPKFFSEAMRFNLSKTGIYASAPFVGACLSKVFTVTLSTVIQTKFSQNLSILRRVIYALCSLLSISCLIGIILFDCTHKIIIVVLTLLIGLASDIAFSGAYWVSLLDMAPVFSGLLSGISNSLATFVGSMAPHGISKLIVVGSKSEWNSVFYIMISAYLFATIIFGIWGSSELQPWAKQKKCNADGANNNDN